MSAVNLYPRLTLVRREGNVSTVDERDQRIRANQMQLRNIDRLIKRVGQLHLAGVDAAAIEIACECGELNCAVRLSVPISLYLRVRSDSALFLVTAGHRKPLIEDAVGVVGGAFEVVRKHPGSVRVPPSSADLRHEVSAPSGRER